LPIALSHFLDRTADGFIKRRFEHDAEKLAGLLVKRPTLSPEGVNRAMGPSFDPADGIRSYAVSDSAGRVLFHGGRPLPIDIRDVPRAASESHLHIGPYEISTLPKRIDGTELWLVLTQDRRRPEVMVDDVVSSFLSRFLWLVPATLMVSLMVAVYFVRRSTERIRAVARTADAIGPRSLGTRLADQELPAETQPLARAVNRALDRMQDAFRSQGEFAANVAHELRTPLALIALRTEGVEDSAVKAQMQAAIGRATHVIDQLMELSQVENLKPKDEPLDLAGLAKWAVEEHAPIVFQSGRTIALDDVPAGVPLCIGSTELSRIALANLIDNAIRHTRKGTDIFISVRPEGCIEVADNGPGITEGDIGEVSRRFWRADAKRSDSAGIGLAIVDRIMSAMGGQLVVSNRVGGGAAFTLSFKQVANS